MVYAEKAVRGAGGCIAFKVNAHNSSGASNSSAMAALEAEALRLTYASAGGAALAWLCRAMWWVRPVLAPGCWPLANVRYSATVLYTAMVAGGLTALWLGCIIGRHCLGTPICTKRCLQSVQAADITSFCMTCSAQVPGPLPPACCVRCGGSLYFVQFLSPAACSTGS